jgi:hypothetical protein
LVGAVHLLSAHRDGNEQLKLAADNWQLAGKRICHSELQSLLLHAASRLLKEAFFADSAY